MSADAMAQLYYTLYYPQVYFYHHSIRKATTSPVILDLPMLCNKSIIITTVKFSREIQ